MPFSPTQLAAALTSTDQSPGDADPNAMPSYFGSYSGSLADVLKANPGTDPNYWVQTSSPVGQGYFYNPPRTGDGFFGGLVDSVKSSVHDLAPAAALFASMYLGGQGLAGLAGAGEAAGGAAGAAGTSGAGGGFLGEGVASGVPAWDTAAINAGVPLSGAGAAGGLSATDYGYTNGMDALSDSATSSGVAPAGAVNAGVSTAWTPSAGVPWSQIGKQALQRLGSSLGSQGNAQMGAANAALPTAPQSPSQYGGTPGYYSIASNPQPSYWTPRSPLRSGLMNMGGQ